MARHFEVQAQRGEVVAEEVVKLAGDADPLVGAAADLQQLGGDGQLRVRLGEALAPFRLLVRHAHGDQRKGREGGVGADDEERIAEGVDGQVEAGHLRGREQHRVPEPHPAELSGDDDQQHRLHPAERLHPDADERQRALRDEDQQAAAVHRAC